MRTLTKLGIGLIVVLLVINAVSLSLLVARQKGQHQPYMLMRIEYLRLKMTDEANYLIARYDIPLIGVFMNAGSGDADIEMWLSWTKDTNIGAIETAIRDSLINALETHLQHLYQLGGWEANPMITCIQKVDDREVDSIVRRVSTRDLKRLGGTLNSPASRGDSNRVPSPTPTAKVVEKGSSTRNIGLQRITADSQLFTDDPEVWIENQGKRVVVSGKVSSAGYGLITLSVGYKSVECKMAQHFTEAELHLLEQQAKNLTIIGTVRMTNVNEIRLQGCRIQ